MWGQEAGLGTCLGAAEAQRAERRQQVPKLASVWVLLSQEQPADRWRRAHQLLNRRPGHGFIQLYAGDVVAAQAVPPLAADAAPPGSAKAHRVEPLALAHTTGTTSASELENRERSAPVPERQAAAAGGGGSDGIDLANHLVRQLWQLLICGLCSRHSSWWGCGVESAVAVLEHAHVIRHAIYHTDQQRSGTQAILT